VSDAAVVSPRGSAAEAESFSQLEPAEQQHQEQQDDRCEH
jgi:hypothetical protein